MDRRRRPCRHSDRRVGELLHVAPVMTVEGGVTPEAAGAGAEHVHVLIHLEDQRGIGLLAIDVRGGPIARTPVQRDLHVCPPGCRTSHAITSSATPRRLTIVLST